MGERRKVVEVVPYDLQWKEQFGKIRDMLAGYLGDTILNEGEREGSYAALKLDDSAASSLASTPPMHSEPRTKNRSYSPLRKWRNELVLKAKITFWVLSP